MNNILKVSYIQYAIAWENPKQNRLFLEEAIGKATNADLYILPETFTTGFSIKKTMAETINGESITWMKQLAYKKNAAIVGSLIVEEEEKIYNRMVFVSPNKEVQFYNKCHLFNYGAEGECFTEGDSSVIFEYLGWKIKPIICYDLRFPVFIRNKENYDIMICVANWPKARIVAWDTLLKARAIENQTYVIGVNRIGVDGNKLEYPGHSNAYDPLGKALSVCNNLNKTTSIMLDKGLIKDVRTQLPFLNDQDMFTIQ